MPRPIPQPGGSGHFAAHVDLVGILNDPAANWPEGNTAFGGGGSSPVGATLRRAEYHSDGQLVDGGFGSWSYALNPGGGGGDDGDQPLDLTDPQNPTIRSAGVYAISATVRSDDVHAGKHWRLFLSPDDENFGWMASASTPLDSAGTVGIWLNVSITTWLPAGATVPLYFIHDVGSPAAFTARIAVQQLTLD